MCRRTSPYISVTEHRWSCGSSCRPGCRRNGGTPTPAGDPAGARPEAPPDESEKARQIRNVERIAQQERVAQAGGELLAAAFGFLGEMVPHAEETEEARRIAEAIRNRLEECLTKDEEDRPKLTVTLPDASAVRNLAASLARLLRLQGPPGAQTA
jgi:hypothetical protein